MARHINTTKANIIFLYLFLTPSKRHRLRLPATYQSIDCSVNKFFRVKANALSRRRWGREWIPLTIVRADNSVARVIWIFDVRIKSKRLVTTGFLFHREWETALTGRNMAGQALADVPTNERVAICRSASSRWIRFSSFLSRVDLWSRNTCAREIRDNRMRYPARWMR